jgi:molybdopterin synthase catalytic subunit
MERGMEEVDICLQREPLDVSAAVARVTCAPAGGISVFLGTTRAQDGPSEAGAPPTGPLVALDYQAYEEMALKQIGKLAATARSRWPVSRLVVWHRVGEVRVGEPSVIVAVSAPHRGEAFDACEYLIDELKKIAPIWKKEVYERAEKWQ